MFFKKDDINLELMKFVNLLRFYILDYVYYEYIYIDMVIMSICFIVILLL